MSHNPTPGSTAVVAPVVFTAQCPTALALEAKAHFRREVAALFADWIAKDNPSWRGLGSSPISELHGKTLPSNREDVRAAHVARLVERIVNGETSEIKLNGAGLKLYVNGVEVSTHPALPRVSFSLNVHGDQRDSYPAFVAYANGQIAARNLHRFKYPQEK